MPGLGAETKLCPLLPYTNPPRSPHSVQVSGRCGLSANTAFFVPRAARQSGHERPPLATRRRLGNTSSQHAAGAALRTLSPLLQKAQAWPPHQVQKESQNPPAHRIQLTWSLGTAPRSPPRSARWPAQESVQPPRTCVPHILRLQDTQLPEGWCPGVLPPQTSQEQGLGSLTRIVFPSGFVGNGVQGGLFRSLTSFCRTSPCSDHAHILGPRRQSLHMSLEEDCFGIS